MSNKTHPPAAPAPGHEHDDDLIVTPKGSSRLRFLLTLGLVLFILVIFVVADMFQYVVGGGGGGGTGGNSIALEWVDPISGEAETVDGITYEQTSYMLNRLVGTGAFRPDSRMYGDQTGRRDDVEDSDVTSFLVYEDLAIDAGIEVSDEEHVDFLKAAFQESANLLGWARRYNQTGKELENDIRRVRRVEKLKELLRSGTRLPDPDAMIASWQEQHPQYRFQYAELSGEGFAQDAVAEVPGDEELVEWWRAKSLGEQQQLWTEEKRIPQVAWIDLDGSYDAATLLAAYPRPEGVDLDQLARDYYERYKAVRFKSPPQETAVDENGDPLPDDDQPVYDPYLVFEDVQETALAEAQISAALGDFLSDLQDRLGAGEEVDLAVEAAGFGLQTYTSPEGMTRAEMGSAEGWGNQNLAQRLGFGADGQLLTSVVIDGDRMYLGRVLARVPREEPALEVLAKGVSKRWTQDRQKEIARERLELARAALGDPPAEQPEDESWMPTVDADTFRTAVEGAGFTVIDREWRERLELPEGGMTAATDGDRFLRNEATDMYELEEGAVPPARLSGTGKAFLVRFGGERPKPADQMTASDLVSLPGAQRFEAMMELGSKAFLGDSEWFVERFKVRHPERERREAEAAGEPKG